MISILLIILKIIGIALLVILGVLLLLLLAVLLVPVRYRLKGSYNESFHCKGKITWLLHLISIRIQVDEGVVTSIRILGIPLSFFQKKKSKVTASVEDVVKDTVKDTVEAVKDEAGTRSSAEDSAEGFAEDASVEQTDEDSAESAPKKEVADTTESAPESATESNSRNPFTKIRQKIQSFIDKIKSIIAKIKDFIRNIKYKKKQLKRYLAILQSDTTKAAFALCKKKIFRMLKHIFPGKLKADITFGFDDPATTGYCLAVYGMLPEYVGKNIIVHPDFDNQVFKADFNIKGKIRAWTLICQVLGILMDKNCKRLYHIVKKEIANEHNK